MTARIETLSDSRAEKLKIAVDLDGVLAETMMVWCRKANEQFGTQVKIEDLDSWASWQKFGISKDDFYRLMDEVWDEWENIPPTEANIAEKVARIGQVGELDIVTGRSKRTIEAARSWLALHKVPYRHFVRVLGWRDKVLLNYDVYVDDAPELMPLISRNPGMWGILYARPWNRDVGAMPRILKAEEWREIPALLRKVAQASTKREGSAQPHSYTARSPPLSKSTDSRV